MVRLLGVKSGGWFKLKCLFKVSYIYIAILESLANILPLYLVYFLARRLFALLFCYLPSLVVFVFRVVYLLRVRFDDIGIIGPIL